MYLVPLAGFVLVVQAVSRRFPTGAARVRAQVMSCGICGGQSGTGAGIIRVLLFPLPILIPPTTPLSSSVIRGGYNRPVSGRRTKWTWSHLTPRNKKKKITCQGTELFSCSDLSEAAEHTPWYY
jgi:hypothetical protein